MTSVRDTAQSAWPMATPMDSVTLVGSDTSPEISRDGLSLWWSSYREGRRDLWFASRLGRDAPWGPSEPTEELNNAAPVASPTVTVDALTMVFTIGRNSQGTRDLYLSRRPDALSDWQPPIALDAVNSDGVEAGAHLSADGLELYFGSDRAGTLDLYVARRANLGETFGPPEPLLELNTELDETDPWISEDRRSIVFSRNEEGENCGFFSAER